MVRRKTGTRESSTVSGVNVAAFIPAPLPPARPKLAITGELSDRLRAAEQALARLELAGEMVPSLDWFIYAFVRKEAVLSSQIEGTQATLDDLLNFEADSNPGPGSADVEEVCNYLEALSFARAQLADAAGLPLSMRLLHETHARLMRGVRGADKQPGEVRRTQNWIGGDRPENAVFVPPPPHLLGDLLTAFENYMYSEDELSPLVRAGLLHVQFETIHPYLDGNGRIGRMLVTLLFEHWQLLQKPLLYLSLYFKRHRTEYYARLTAVRESGDWEGWIKFFLDGVATIADEAVASAREIFGRITVDRMRTLQFAGTSVAAVRLFEQLPKHPVVSVASAIDQLGVAKPTAGRAVEVLERAGVLVERTGKRRDRSWVYRRYLDILRVGMEPEAVDREVLRTDEL